MVRTSLHRNAIREKSVQFSQPLHGLRGIASLMVLVAHISFGFYDHFYHDDPSFALIAQGVANFGTYGVELFFVISGYVITASCLRYTPRQFAGRRFWRLYPVFALFTLLYFVLNIVTHYEPAKLGLDKLVINLLFLDLFVGTEALTPNAWSISYEVWYYIATYGLLWFLLRSQASWRIVGAILFLVLAGFMLAAFDITLYFAGGALLYFVHQRLRPTIPNGAATWTAAAAFAVIAVIATTMDFPTQTYFEVPGSVVPALLLVAATLIFVQAVLFSQSLPSRWLCSRPVRFIGTISYTLYLAHPYVYIVVRETCRKLQIGDYPWQLTILPYMVVTISIALGLSWIIHKLVEIGPYELIYGSRIYREAEAKDPGEQGEARDRLRRELQ